MAYKDFDIKAFLDENDIQYEVYESQNPSPTYYIPNYDECDYRIIEDDNMPFGYYGMDILNHKHVINPTALLMVLKVLKNKRKQNGT